MSHDFMPGDKVVCIDPINIGPGATIVLNAVYTVQKVNSQCIWPREEGANFGFYKARFKLAHAPAVSGQQALANVLTKMDRAAGMVPMSGTVPVAPVMKPAAIAVPFGRSHAIDVSPTTYAWYNFLPSARKRGA